MESIAKFIHNLDSKITHNINNLKSNKKNNILNYDRTITTSLVILNILNLLKKRK